MLARYKTRTNWFVGIGTLLLFFRNLIGQEIGAVFALVGFVLFIIGCFNYAKAKGYNSALGLFGFLWLLGLLILVCLPDKRKE